MITAAEQLNRVRWAEQGRTSLHETFLLVVRLPPEDAALRVRYTLRRPAPGRGEPDGSLEAVWTAADGRRVAGCETWPAAEIAAGRSRFYLRVGPGELSMGRASGRVATADGPVIAWDLSFATGTPSLSHLPAGRLEALGLLRRGVTVPHVTTRFLGSIRVGDRETRVKDAPGMQGHDWGPALAPHAIRCHADRFEGGEDAVFEAVSSTLRAGPLELPLTSLYLRVRGTEVLLNRPDRMVRTRAVLSGTEWRFAGSGDGARIEGRAVLAPALAVGLDCRSADGADVRLVVSDLADCELAATVPGRGEVRLAARRGASLELGGRAAPPGVPVLARG